MLSEKLRADTVLNFQRICVSVFPGGTHVFLQPQIAVLFFFFIEKADVGFYF